MIILVCVMATITATVAMHTMLITRSNETKGNITANEHWVHSYSLALY